jgi:hypothetical protein
MACVNKSQKLLLKKMKGQAFYRRWASSVFCDMIWAELSASVVDDNIPYAVHGASPITRPNNADLSEIADILN